MICIAKEMAARSVGDAHSKKDEGKAREPCKIVRQLDQ